MKMADRLIDRIKAHKDAPDVYDAPTFEDMADRIEELMTAKEKAYDEGFDAGYRKGYTVCSEQHHERQV